ncbi:MAG: glycerol-3-phosphate 1-O-acyltransferase PlsB [Endozoicomonadaceae bacterium]|nr:glycerol-3-phosphate 1-O-acyltransferase PlsB [Endozoicomonadaceae bacterium]
MNKPIPLNRFLFGLLRLMLFWIQTRAHNNSLESLGLDADKPIVYVLPNYSLSNLLVLDKECLKAGLPRPYTPLISGHFIHEKHAYFFLSRSKGLFLQRERIYHSDRLIRMVNAVEKQREQDIQIVPVSIFWGRAPDKESSPFKLLFAWNYHIGSRFRKCLAILIHGRQTVLHFGSALSLREIVDENLSHQRTLRKISRLLRVHFRQIHASIIGPDLSHRRILINGIIRSSIVCKAIAERAETQSTSLEKAEAKALYYAREIASDFNYSAIRFLDKVLTWFWNKIYNGVDVNHIEPVRKLAGSHELIYVPCHRSHVDYLLLAYVLFYNGLQPPHTAAGINLNMPLIGPLLRRCGAFFMRRSFKDNPLYSAVFNEYMHTLLTRGFPTEYFVEGGRSRTGRTLPPKTGLLAITLHSFLRNHRKPIAFIPVYIGYEKLLEINTYLSELHDKAKKKESPFDIIRTVASLKSSFGHAYVNFGEPIELDQFLNQEQPAWKEAHYGDNSRPEWLRHAINNLGTLIVSRINSAAAINPINLVATVLLSAPRHALGEEELIIQLEACQKLLQKVPYSDHTTLPSNLSGQDMIRYVESMEMVYRQTDSLGDIIRMDDRNAILMTYYRNNILHLFAIPSLISRMFVNSHAIEQQEVIDFCCSLYPYLKSELFLQWDQTALDSVIICWLSALADAGLITAEGTRWRCPESGSTGFVTLTILSRPIQQTLERFYVVISLLLRNGSGQVDAEFMESQSRDMAQRLSVIHGMNAPEFFDTTLFRHFIEALQHNAVIHINDENKLEFGEDMTVVAKDAMRVLPSEIRHSILQVTHAGS